MEQNRKAGQNPQGVVAPTEEEEEEEEEEECRGQFTTSTQNSICLPRKNPKRTEYFARSPCYRSLSVPSASGPRIKRPVHSQLNWAILLWRHTWRKNWIKCAVLTGNNAGIRTVLSGRLSHTELHSSLGESHSFLSLPADTTMTSSQGTSVSSNSFSRWASHGIFLLKCHFLLHILRFLFFFSDNIMADVASKRQPCFYPP